MNKTTAKRTAVLLTAAMLATGVTMPRPASAADVTFPNADGSWQILSPDAWGGTVPTTDRPKFSATNPTYYVDRDGSLNGMYIDYKARWGNNRYTFQFQNGAKLTLGASISGTRDWGDSSSGWCSVLFKDGTIDFDGKTMLSGNDQAIYVKMNFDGCTVTNVNNMWMSKYSHDRLTISNSTVWINHVLMPGYVTGPTDTRLFIGGGSKVSAGQFTMSRSYNGGSIGKHTDGLPLVDISGAGTEVIFRGDANTDHRYDDNDIDNDVNLGYSLLASFGNGEIFRIGDGAKVTVKKGHAIIGITKGANNRVIVEGEGSELTVAHYAFAWRGDKTTGSTNNYIIVRDGGKFTTSGRALFYGGVGGADNGIVCSNGIVTTVGPKYEYNSTRNRLTFRMQGDNPSFRIVTDSYNEGAYLTGGLNWVFDLPAGGYRAGCVPFRFGDNQILESNADSSVLTCTINGFAEFCNDMRAKDEIQRDVVLITGGKFATWNTFSPAKYNEAVARWNDELQAIVPDGFKAELVRSGNTTVKLKVKRILATLISIH